MATVELEHVDKTFPDGTRAVIDVTFSIADGERLVVVGPSGCGKSTVLRIVAGLEVATKGSVRIGGRPVDDLSPKERNVAMVFQDYALYPYRTVRGNLEFPLRMRGMARDEMRRRVERAAEQLELGALLDRLPRELSGGQRQRVAMGRALVREPTVFLLDEPLSNLDAKLRGQVRAEIADLQRKTGTTMMYVTHDQVEAMTLGDRVTVMDRGRVQQISPPHELYESPANVFVAGFVGTPPMNLFPTRIARNGGGWTVTVASQQASITPGRVADRVPAETKLTAGIRPEALSLASEGEKGAVDATIEHVEMLGHETLVAARVGDRDEAVRLIARLPAIATVARDARIRLRLDQERIYLFGEDGRAITAQSRA